MTNNTENRTWTRLSPADKRVQLKTAAGVVTADVVDVSFGGVAIALNRSLDLAEGDAVDICWRGAWMRGAVRYASDDEGEMRLGVQWAPNTTPTGG